jgi:tetratricopeptide (TPR) repeat protein
MRFERGLEGNLGGNVRYRSIKGMIFTGVIIFLMAFYAGCGGRSDSAMRYEMERMLAQADRQQEQIKLKGNLSDDDVNTLAKAYNEIAAMAPAFAGPADIDNASEDKKQAWALGSLAISRIGSLYLNLGRFEQAYEQFKLVADNPTTSAQQKNAITSYMALALEKSGRHSDAAALYDSLASGYLSIIEPENPNMDALDAPLRATEMWALAQDQNRYFEKMAEAETYYKNLIDKYRGTLMESAAVGKLAAAYLKQSRPADAIEVLRTVRDSLGFVSPGVLLTIADIYMSRLRDFPNSEKTYNEFLERYSSNDKAPAARLGLALSLFEQTRYAEARRAAEGIERMPNVSQETGAQALYLTAVCYEKEDKWELARGQYEIVKTSFMGLDRSFEATLHIPDYYRQRGMTELADKAFDDAVRFIEKYAAENAANPVLASRAFGYLVRAYTEKGDYAEAAKQLAALHDRFPQLPEGKFAPLRLGEIYEKVLFDTAGAIGWLNTYIQENPGEKNLQDLINHVRDLESRLAKRAG